MSTVWIYMLGEVGGGTIKIGHTKGRTPRERLDRVNGSQMSNDRYVMLCALRGDTKDETEIGRYFARHRRNDMGGRKEYFHADAELVEYASWLRRGWWSEINPNAEIDTAIEVDPSFWLPEPERRSSPPPLDETVLIQEWDTRDGHLAGTAWSWMPDPKASFQDYFTPPEIVEAARTAMGDIDLDAAGHWAANRIHRIPDYFDVNRSAFDHQWHGRVWLNPPYGNNAPWFARILEMLDDDAISQLCMLSPVWVFNTDIARPVMERVAGMILLAPTPKFWGNADPAKIGANHPHAIIYIGDRTREFFTAFTPGFGIPFLIPRIT